MNKREEAMTERDRLAALLHESAIGCWYDSHHMRYCEPDYEHHAKHADRLIAAGVGDKRDLAARIVAAVEGLPGMTVTEYYVEPLWVDRLAVLDAIREASGSLPHFEPDHFRSIWFENVRVFENEEGTGWRCVNDESGDIGDGSTPEAAIAAMFTALAEAAEQVAIKEAIRDIIRRVSDD